MSYITKLNSLGIIELNGPQAAEYLQGQITINTATLDEPIARLGAHCDFKGKTWSVFTALKNNETYSLISSKSSLEKSLGELKKYGVFSKVDIEDASNNYAFFGIKGQDNIAKLRKHFTTFTETHLSLSFAEYGVAICYSLNQITAPITLVIVKSNHEDDFLGLFEGSELSSSEAWDYDYIANGLVNLSESTSNEFVPQMLNLQAVAGIDFDKGCYMGQETIARTKFLGKNKRATYHLLASPDIQTLAAIQNINLEGAALEKQAGENWRSGGTLLQSAQESVAENSTISALAVLSNDTEEGAMIRLKEEPRLIFTVQPLPFSLEEK